MEKLACVHVHGILITFHSPCMVHDAHVYIQLLSACAIVSTIVALGELDFISLEEVPGVTSNPVLKSFSDSLESTRQRTWDTAICLAIVSFLAVIVEVTLLILSFFSCIADSPTPLLIVVRLHRLP